MLRTRLWMGAALIALTLAMLIMDQRLAPWFPFLLVLVLCLSLLGCHELLQLLPARSRPVSWLCYAGVAGVLIVNWVPHVWANAAQASAWAWIISGFTAFVLLAFLVEMARFQVPGESVPRIALSLAVVAYLGILPSFLVQLRWLGSTDEAQELRRGTAALALAIFVPKCCDIGAYFTGRLFGRHQMVPILSPKKTWEGAAGGLAVATVVALGIDQMASVVRGSLPMAAGLGLALGVAGMLGDLAESLIKRDCQQKDASNVVPGFGGVLDVVDAILFGAPVAYWWLQIV
jgi:phosphatidate cytidylyltransferase